VFGIEEKVSSQVEIFFIYLFGFFSNDNSGGGGGHPTRRGSKCSSTYPVCDFAY
jgi:hypothetical protein